VTDAPFWAWVSTVVSCFVLGVVIGWIARSLTPPALQDCPQVTDAPLPFGDEDHDPTDSVPLKKRKTMWG
jgi:hypothetical protein